MPRVSVIITTYNNAAYLAEAVESVLTQTYLDREIWVIDDGSTDDTQRVLEPYLDRIQYIWQENQERSFARNRGLKLARGSLISFLDGDDIWLPDKLAVQVEALERFPKAVMAYGCAQIVDVKGNPTRWWGADTLGLLEGQTELVQEGREILYGSIIMPTITLIRRKAIDQIGEFDTTIHRGIGEDWDFWIRLSGLGPFVRIPKLVAQYRTYGSERELRKRANDYYIERSQYIIEKNVQANPDRFPPQVIQRARANIYLQAGLASLELGAQDIGNQWMTQAIKTDPTLAAPQSLRDFVEHLAWRKWRSGDGEPEILKSLRCILQSLPEKVQANVPNPNKIMARVYFSETFTAYQNNDWATVRQVIWRGLAADPSWLANRGVLSIVARSLIEALKRA